MRKNDAPKISLLLPFEGPWTAQSDIDCYSQSLLEAALCTADTIHPQVSDHNGIHLRDKSASFCWFVSSLSKIHVSVMNAGGDIFGCMFPSNNQFRLSELPILTCAPIIIGRGPTNQAEIFGYHVIGYMHWTVIFVL